MTATVAKIPDPLTVLTRAERKATGEEPGDLSHLADAVRVHIMEPLTAGGTPVVDDVQVKQLRADKERLEGVVAESRALAASRGKTVDAQAREIAELKLRLADRPALGVDASLLDQAQRDNARLADQLAKAEEQLSLTRRDLALANRTLDEIADEENDRPAAAQHRHRYPLDGTGAPLPCDCGQRHPHDPAAYETEEVEPDAEPLTALLSRIGAELTEAGWHW